MAATKPTVIKSKSGKKKKKKNTCENEVGFSG